MPNDVLASLSVQITAQTAQMGAALNLLNKQLNQFGANIQKQNSTLGGLQKTFSTIQQAAGQLGLAFGASQIIGFIGDVTRLAGEAAGVEAAFNRLPNATRLIAQLRDATGGTVSELELMKQAVRSSNFDISLEALPRLLEFAAVRAQQTGENVDYLVNSIITGIGRKSPLILDNLGISTSRLKAEFGGAALEAQSIAEVAEAVGRIAGGELQKMGGLTETVATKTQRLAASWKDLKAAIGETANETGIFSAALDKLTEGIKLFSSDSTSTFQKLEALSLAVVSGGLSLVALGFEDAGKKADEAAAAQKRLEIVQRSADEAMEKFGNHIGLFIEELKRMGGQQDLIAEITSRIAKTEEERAKEIENIATLTAKLNDLEKQRLTQTGDQLAATNREIISIQEKIKTLQQLGTLVKKLSIAPEPIAIPITFDVPDLDIVGDLGKELLNAVNNIVPKEGLVIPIQVDFQAGEKLQEGATGEVISEQLDLIRQKAVDTALGISGALNDAVQSAIAGQQSFVQAIAANTIQLLGEFQKQALGAALAKFFSQPGTPFPILLATAGLAISAVKGLFSKIGATTGAAGGAAGSIGGGTSSGIQMPRNFQTERAGEQIVLVGGEFRVRGNDLVLALDKTNTIKQRTG